MYFVELCEGWNLISVPGNLVYSSPLALFNVRTNVGVTKVYYYPGGTFGIWQYALLDPLRGTWSGTLTTIEPGKAYWVWVSPPYMELVLHTLPPDPMTPPPAYSLKKGYNMVGYTQFGERQGSGDTLPMRMQWYWRSIPDSVGPVLYCYDPCKIFYDFEEGWIRFDTGGKGKWNDQDMVSGAGYWLFLTEDWLFAP